MWIILGCETNKGIGFLLKQRKFLMKLELKEKNFKVLNSIFKIEWKSLERP